MARCRTWAEEGWAISRVGRRRWTVRVAVIQALIPLGLQAVAALLQDEVRPWAGRRYARGEGLRGHVRWSHERGSISLADQTLGMAYPRVRNRQTNTEGPWQSYARRQQPRVADEGVLRRILRGLRGRHDRECAEAVPEAFGLSASTLSRRYIRASARTLQALQERRLDGDDLVVLVVDGKIVAD